MNGKGVFLLSENPFPPRNGVTIPTYNHLNFFYGSGRRCFVYYADNNGGDERELNEIRRIPLIKYSPLVKMFREFFLGCPYFLSDIDSDAADNIVSKSGKVDFIYFSPISMAGAAEKLRQTYSELTGHSPKVVASISDCYTSVLRTSLFEGASKYEIRNYIKYFRSLYMGKLERKILEKSDAVIVQTKADKNWLKKIGFYGDVKIITNGVLDSLFDLSVDYENEIMFAGNFKSNFYQEKFVWFYKNVWLRVINSEPSLKLYVYTSGYVPEHIAQMVSNDRTVVLEGDFVKDLRDIYLGKGFCVAPIYKKYGFINKVAEAMAAGLVVIGDESAFNGMDGFVPGVHGIVARNADSFSASIIAMCRKKELSAEIGAAAKYFAKENFSWASKSELLEDVIR